MKTMRIAVSVFVAAAVLAVAWQAAAKEFTVSPKWKGADSQTTGNPLQVDGKDTWRADAVLNADPMAIDSYVPMKWSAQQKRWTGGAAGAAVMPAPNLQIGGAGQQQGKPGQKLGVLGFIAPADGTYTMFGTATIRVWQGKACEKLLVVKIDRAEKKVTEVASLPIEVGDDGNPKTIDLTSVKAELKAGQELAIMLSGLKGTSGCNAILNNFGVTDGTVTSRPAQSGPSSAPAGGTGGAKGAKKPGGKKAGG